MVHNIKKLAKFKNMALVDSFANQNERFIVYNLFGFIFQIKRKFTNEFVINIEVFIILEYPETEFI